MYYADSDAWNIKFIWYIIKYIYLRMKIWNELLNCKMKNNYINSILLNNHAKRRKRKKTCEKKKEKKKKILIFWIRILSLKLRKFVNYNKINIVLIMTHKIKKLFDIILNVFRYTCKIWNDLLVCKMNNNYIN